MDTLSRTEGILPKIKLDDLSMPNYVSKKEQKENRKLQTDKFLEELDHNKKDSEMIYQYLLLQQQGFKPNKFAISSLTEKVFTLLGFDKVHSDQAKFTMVFKSSNNNKSQDLFITFIIDARSDLISLTAHINPSQYTIDINNYIHKDILSYLTNQCNSEIPFITIEYSQQKRAIQCQMSTIGQLDENYVNWLFLNIDGVTIACLESNSAFFQMYQSGNGPYESQMISEKTKNSIKSRIEANKENYNRLLENIEQEFHKCDLKMNNQ